MDDRKEKIFSLRLSKAEMQYLQETAAAKGWSVGGFIRWLIKQFKETR